MSLEITGKTIQVLEPVTGEGKNGTWKKQEVVIETPGDYPKKVCVAMWGDKINQAALVIGADVTAQIEVESREYNGRWYSEIKAWKTEVTGEQAQQPQAPAPNIDLPESPLPF